MNDRTPFPFGSPGSRLNSSSLRRPLTIVFLLLAVTTMVYYPVAGFDFVDLDDDGYVFRNERIRAGLTLENIRWALQATAMANWHPVTWLSYMLDAEMFGISPGAFHLTNLVFHLANSLLLFLLLQMATSRPWRSAAVAALFALHPLHVESVAWVSERKDVLSTFFWLLCSLAYLQYGRRQNRRWYLVVVALFTLGLAAKPMVVTLPIILLLMDYWPLERFGRQPTGPGTAGERLSPAFLIFEKVPLLLLALAGGLATLLAQKGFAAVQSLEALPVVTRLANASIATIGYLAKMVWPVSLTVLYPYPDQIPYWEVCLALGLILAVSLAAFVLRRRRPYLAVGWLWYLITLLPVIGIIQVGSQAMADRYTYIPLIGIFIMIAWGVSDLCSKWRVGRLLLPPVCGAVLIALAVAARHQVYYWQDSVILFKHALVVNGDTYLVHNGLGLGYESRGSLRAAETHYQEALRLNPGFSAARYNLGNVYLQLGQQDKAVRHFEKALEGDPSDPEVLNNLAKALVETGDITRGLATFRKALKRRPDDPGLTSNYAAALIVAEQYDNAAALLENVVQRHPHVVRAHLYLGILCERRGRQAAADRHYETVLQLAPENSAARRGRQRIAAGARTVDEQPAN